MDNKKYSIVLRDLSDYANMDAEIDKLDLFNHPTQFNEINNQFMDEYGYSIEICYHPFNTEYSYRIVDQYLNEVEKSSYWYGSEIGAIIQGLVDLARYVYDHNVKYNKITEENIEKAIKRYETRWIALPAYIIKNKLNN